ncbi:TRAP transporter small permease [Chachezhania antarctica]|uniref:TRAP transporter small permease n=1 Tax=Chachezhania antarctica TaxID=2340860 RepID=UPI000EAEC25B|nr:TRAP transporter small permease [Chachezhania antarctica]|tara:strand:+ start:1079 stop:1597 length:519 start_codon:yes stop_codon:yes gene_type:complete
MILSTISRLSVWAERASLAIAGAAAVYMMAVIAFNVVTRILFDATGRAVNLMIPGAVEQASYALLILVMAALAASMRDGMISVDLFVNRMPAIVQKLAVRLWYALAMVLALVLAWSFGHEAQILLNRGDVTQDLVLPLWWFYSAITVECLALALISFDQALTATHVSEGHLS